jgi:hypothetical protein
MVMEVEKKKLVNKCWTGFGDPEWCPLFGYFPSIEDISSISSYKRAQIDRCSGIIKEARSLWGVADPLDLIRSGKDPGQVRYSERALFSARRIFARGFTICLNAQMYYGDDGPKIDPDQANESALVLHARDTIGVEREIEDFKVFAILSIKYAHYCFRRILENRTPEDDLETLKRLQIGDSFLLRAEASKRMAVASKGGKESAKSRSRKFNWKEIQGMADKYWSQHRTLSKDNVAHLIHGEFKNNHKKKIPQIGTISKKILKPT